MNEATADATRAAIGRAGGLTVYELFAAQARDRPSATAILQGDIAITYAELDGCVRRLAAALAARGLGRGSVIALLSENRHEYAEIQLAAARLGAVVACQNWRLSRTELAHCVALVGPALLIASQRFAEAAAALDIDVPRLVIERDYADLIAAAPNEVPPVAAEPEDPLIVLYTSGTTGLPKGAAISHRAEIARNAVLRMDMRATEADGFVAWAPMFHMGSTDQVLGALMSGSTVHVVDGFNAERIVAIMEHHLLGWLLLMPGSIEPVVELLKARGIRPRGIRAVGAMADLVPLKLMAELSGLTGAPYLNSFGSTETGLPPASAMLIPPGTIPERLSKRKSSMCDLRLVDPDGNDVPDGEPGEAAVRGPTVFSGYWNAAATNARDFAGGYFRMGDLFRRNPDGSYDFVDRAKYMIKSGGENIYPAEIERVLLADARIGDAIVLRRADSRWGEVPVAFVARTDENLGAEEIDRLCKEHLAGYKRPKAIHFIRFEDFPRSTTGKILRHEMERLYKDLLI
ncbi:hypothetical protein ABB55_02270 [Prosthecomicrobium hirschii]|uniref:Acid--CoA ligase n=1 Tax=Prosthecodimorpha hirschii TaxID=665126 RepID=A0A0P6VZE3_9HYPH|nr:AMP-binding protein [Prosthecomicrobium hirschii]KPL51187.1 hypothetical protein ABB55_02270 [Prosthecomicrobium hirschii]